MWISLQNGFDLGPHRFDLRLEMFAVNFQFRVHEFRYVLLGLIAERICLVHHIYIWLPKRALSLQLVSIHVRGSQKDLAFIIHVSKYMKVVLNELVEFRTILYSFGRENYGVRDKQESFIGSNWFLGRQPVKTRAKHSRVLDILIENCTVSY